MWLFGCIPLSKCQCHLSVECTNIAVVILTLKRPIKHTHQQLGIFSIFHIQLYHMVTIQRHQTFARLTIHPMDIYCLLSYNSVSYKCVATNYFAKNGILCF